LNITLGNVLRKRKIRKNQRIEYLYNILMYSFAILSGKKLYIIFDPSRGGIGNKLNIAKIIFT